LYEPACVQPYPSNGLTQRPFSALKSRLDVESEVSMQAVCGNQITSVGLEAPPQDLDGSCAGGVGRRRAGRRITDLQAFPQKPVNLLDDGSDTDLKDTRSSNSGVDMEVPCKGPVERCAGCSALSLFNDGSGVDLEALYQRRPRLAGSSNDGNSMDLEALYQRRPRSAGFLQNGGGVDIEALYQDSMDRRAGCSALRHQPLTRSLANLHRGFIVPSGHQRNIASILDGASDVAVALSSEPECEPACEPECEP